MERRKPRAERLPRRLLLSFGQERSVSARMMAAVTAEKGSEPFRTWNREELVTGARGKDD